MQKHIKSEERERQQVPPAQDIDDTPEAGAHAAADKALDEALEDSFPASDPPAQTQPPAQTTPDKSTH